MILSVGGEVEVGAQENSDVTEFSILSAPKMLSREETHGLWDLMSGGILTP